MLYVKIVLKQATYFLKDSKCLFYICSQVVTTSFKIFCNLLNAVNFLFVFISFINLHRKISVYAYHLCIVYLFFSHFLPLFQCLTHSSDTGTAADTQRRKSSNWLSVSDRVTDPRQSQGNHLLVPLSVINIEALIIRIKN